MDQFAIWVVTGIEMRTVSETFVCLLVDYGSEMFLVAKCMSFSLLAPISSAMIAVL
jgi:hypothetical protein